MLKNTYFCENCRNKVEDLTQLFFVEENSDRGFCSEKCIKSLYHTFMSLLEQEEIEFRSELNLHQEEDFLRTLSDEVLLDSCIRTPDECWLLYNDIDQKFYTHIKKFIKDDKELFLILIGSYIEDSISFVYYRTITESIALVHKYRREQQIQLEDPFENLLEESFADTNNYKTEESVVSFKDLPQEVIESLELKKSWLLADLLEVRKESDIAFEEFMDFEEYFAKTMDQPDEIFQDEDKEGDELLIYIRSYQRSHETFFYIILGHTYKNKSTNETLVIPILSFPSNDKDLYPMYAKGVRLKDIITN